MKMTIFATAAIAALGMSSQVVARTAEHPPPLHDHFDSNYLDAMKDSRGRITYGPVINKSVVFTDSDARSSFYPALLDAFKDDTNRGPQERVHINEPGVK